MAGADEGGPVFIGTGILMNDKQRRENDLYVVPGAIIVVPEQKLAWFLRKFPIILVIASFLGVLDPGSRRLAFWYVLVASIAIDVIVLLALRHQRRKKWKQITQAEVDSACTATDARTLPLADMQGFREVRRKWGVVLEFPRIQFREEDLSLHLSRPEAINRVTTLLEAARQSGPRPV